MNHISFTYKADLKSYITLCFRQLYKTWTIWIYYSIFAICVFSAILDIGITSIDPIITVAFSALILISIHLRIYVFAKRRYKTSPTVDEERFWTIDDNGIEIKATSASTSMAWKSIYKIKNDEKWVFIYYNKSSSNYFPKSLLSDFDLSEIKRKVFENKAII